MTWIALISDRAKAIKKSRRGLIVRWDLHGGSEFRIEAVPEKYIAPSSDIKEPNDFGCLIVYEVWARAHGITPLKYIKNKV